MFNKFKKLTNQFLIKSQKYTETDNIYIAKYGSYLIVGNIISIIASLFLSIAFAQLLPKETYGQYRYILSIMSILAIFSLQGIHNAIIRGVAKGFEDTFKKGFKTRLKWSFLGSIVSIGVAFYFWTQGNIEFTASFFIVAIFLPLFKSGETYQSYLDGKKLFGKRATYTNLVQILSSVLIVLVLFLTKNLVILILVYFSSYSLLRTFFLFLTIKKTKPNKLEDSETISYGKHLSLMGVLGIIAQQIDKILLFNFLGPIQLAIYSFALLPIDHIRTPFQIIQELALPKLSTKSTQDIKKTLSKKLLKSTILIGVTILIYIIVAPYFFKIFYSQYMESVFYSRLLCLTLFVFPTSMMTLSLLAKMKTKELYKISIINSVIKIILISILTPLYGILGVVIAILSGQIFYFFMVLFFFKKI